MPPCSCAMGAFVVYVGRALTGVVGWLGFLAAVAWFLLREAYLLWNALSYHIAVSMGCLGVWGVVVGRLCGQRSARWPLDRAVLSWGSGPTGADRLGSHPPRLPCLHVRIQARIAVGPLRPQRPRCLRSRVPCPPSTSL